MTTATLAGYPLKTTPEVGWAFTAGVQPYERIFRVSNAVAERLKTITGPVTLRIDAPPRPRLEVEQLWILSIEASDSPHFKLVRVADDRWRWQYEFVIRHYNQPRRAGTYRRLQQEGVPVQVQQVQADITYAQWSLYPRENPKDPWTPVQALEDILKKVAKNGYKIGAGLKKLGSVIVGAQFKENGAVAIARALTFLPGAQITIDKKGRAIVYDELDDGELELYSRGPVYKGPSLAALVSLARRRPSRVDVLFDRQVELRFDSIAESDATIVSNESDQRFLENVAPIPDLSLVVNGQTLAQGTWVTFSDLFASWPDPIVKRRLSHRVVQRHWLIPSFMDIYARPNGTKTPNVQWAQRVGCVLRNYRQTYRVTKRWMDRLRSISPYRVAMLDPSRGTRARASVFSNYAIAPTVMGLATAAADGHTAAIWNVTGYSTLLTQASQAAPATISIEDDDQGVFRIHYALDGAGEIAKVFPSKVVDKDGLENNLPSYDLRKAQNGKGEGLLLAYGQLAPDHRVAVVLTVEPGAPNDERICHVESVTPEEAGKALGIPVGDSKGPVWKIHVSDRHMRALTEWLDTYGDSGAIDDLFGITNNGGFLGLASENASHFKSKLGRPTNWKEVREVAVAAAAALYSTLLDGLQGQHAIRLSPSASPTGRAARVEHSLRPGGGTRTVVSFPRLVHGVDLVSLLPEDLQRRLLGAPEQPHIYEEHGGR